MAISHHQLASALRFLSIACVEKAKSGHLGLPLGMADVVTVLLGQFLKFYVFDPKWPDRDRLVLSAGHGSALLYSLLYLLGYSDITLEDLKQFRQLHAKTQGHPEYGVLSGIETTTGPLGQGLANAVGMAVAERYKRYTHGEEAINHFTYVIVSDGDLMEGISHEAASFAGHQQLGKLIVFFDDNQTTIDGPTSLCNSDDHQKRFESYRWQVLSIDGHDPQQIATSIKDAQRCSDKPTLIMCKTVIGYGAPTKEGTSSAHSGALGASEIELTKKRLGWNSDLFVIDTPILNAWRNFGIHYQSEYAHWKQSIAITTQHALEKESNKEHCINELLDQAKQNSHADQISRSTRESFGLLLPIIKKHIACIGGSSDLSPSNNTQTSISQVINTRKPNGNYIHYGIREHAMGAIMNGIKLHGAIFVYGGTFLVFSDYLRPALRLSCLMELPILYVFTHDSIGVGEDGPTHQPIEHLASLRAIPNLLVMRPSDTVEVAESMAIVLQQTKRPIALILSRQISQHIRKDQWKENRSVFGGYKICSSFDSCQYDLTLIASGTEVGIAIETKKILEKIGKIAVVVSMPCLELFHEQSKSYKESVLGEKPRIFIEASNPISWHQYTRDGDCVIGIHRFGTSGSWEKVYDYFHLTPEKIIEEIVPYI
jgi:transketolase